MYHLERQNESDDHLQSHSAHHCPTIRCDDEDILDEMEKDSDKAATEAKRRVDEVHANA